MQPLKLKVNRVRHSSEVEMLEDLDVDYIGFDVDDDAAFKISEDALWDDDRYVLEQELEELLSHVRKAKTVVQRPVEAVSADTVAKLAGQGVQLLQYRGFSALPDDVETGCERWPVQLVPSGFFIEPDDERGFYDYLRTGRPCVAFYELQIFPSYQDSAWSFLTASPPRRPEGALGLDDIVDLASSVPLFVSLNTATANAAEIVETLSPTPVAGLSFTLSPASLGSFHTLEFPELTRVLEIVRTSRPVS